MNGETDARTIRREQDCGEIQSNGDETDKFFCYQFFIGGQSDCVETFGDTQSFKLTGWIIKEACGKGQGSEVCETAGRLCHQHRGNLWQLNTKDIQEIPKFQEVHKTQNPNIEFGHIFVVHHQTMHHTWRKCSRSQERFMIENRQISGKTSMCTPQFGVYSSFQASVHLGRDFYIEFTICQESTLKVCATIMSDD